MHSARNQKLEQPYFTIRKMSFETLMGEFLAVVPLKFISNAFPFSNFIHMKNSFSMLHRLLYLDTDDYSSLFFSHPLNIDCLFLKRCVNKILGLLLFEAFCQHFFLHLVDFFGQSFCQFSTDVIFCDSSHLSVTNTRINSSFAIFCNNSCKKRSEKTHR